MSADVYDLRCAADLDADLPSGVQAALDVLARAAETTTDPGLSGMFLAVAGAVRSAADPDVAAGMWEQMRWTPVERVALRMASEVLAGAR